MHCAMGHGHAPGVQARAPKGRRASRFTVGRGTADAADVVGSWRQAGGLFVRAGTVRAGFAARCGSPWIGACAVDSCAASTRSWRTGHCPICGARGSYAWQPALQPHIRARGVPAASRARDRRLSLQPHARVCCDATTSTRRSRVSARPWPARAVPCLNRLLRHRGYEPFAAGVGRLGRQLPCAAWAARRALCRCAPIARGLLTGQRSRWAADRGAGAR